MAGSLRSPGADRSPTPAPHPLIAEQTSENVRRIINEKSEAASVNLAEARSQARRVSAEEQLQRLRSRYEEPKPAAPTAS